jgi:hypothetical protein
VVTVDTVDTVDMVDTVDTEAMAVTEAMVVTEAMEDMVEKPLLNKISLLGWKSMNTSMTRITPMVMVDTEDTEVKLLLKKISLHG